MSGKIKQLINSRGNYRGQVNTIHKEKGNFIQKSVEDRECISRKLERLQDELNKLDVLIRDLK